MDAPDTRKSSAITDHPFEPRTKPVRFAKMLRHSNQLQPTPYLCAVCRMAEAAHAETTVKR
jgi:hypothetical protein